MGKYLKIWNLVISKPENHNLGRKTAIEIEFEFNRKKKHSFIADNKLQVDNLIFEYSRFWYFVS